MDTRKCVLIREVSLFQRSICLSLFVCVCMFVQWSLSITGPRKCVLIREVSIVVYLPLAERKKIFDFARTKIESVRLEN